MIPLAVRVGVTLLGLGMFVASFVVRTSVDRGLRITRDAGPNLSQDAGAFTLRALGAVILAAGLLTWVIAYSFEHRGARLF